MISHYAWLVPALPALSALLIFAFGKRMPGKGAELGIVAVAVALGLSVGIAYEVFSANVERVQALEHAEEEHAGLGVLVASAVEPAGMLVAAEPADPEAGHGIAALPAGVDDAFLHEARVLIGSLGEQTDLHAGMRVDGLTAMMFLLVTFVSLMVHIYSTGYMAGDPRYTYFFNLLSIFTMSMLVLVIADNLFQVLVGWELVGVCSYLLIGFWWEERKNSDAAMKAFITTKLGDVGLIVGVVAMWVQFGTFDISAIISMATAGTQAGGAALNEGLLTFALIAIFIGGIGKSAQFPLSTWLPDAMAGPTPVSALIHAATMVTAGIFIIARLYPLYQLSQPALNMIAVIGAITLLSAGLLALVQDDIKRVLAYSTVSQLGYMVAALAFSYTAGIFHLFTHGFFKALLFLGSGSVIHAVHSNNMSDMGGLRKYMPTTHWTFVLASLALAAIFPLSGFWSKDEVLAGALGAGGPTGNLVWILGLLGGGITAFYMARAVWMTFYGSYRGHGTPHESPPSMAWPLVVLAVPTALIGFINLPFDFAHPYGFAAWTSFSLVYFENHPAEFNLVLALGSTIAAVVGITIGARLYATYRSPAEDPVNNLGWTSTVLQRRYYLDDLYSGVIMHSIRDRLAPLLYWINDHVIDRAVYLAGLGTKRVGDALYAVVDQRGIDGAVNGVGVGTNWTGSIVKYAQSGNVQFYAGAMFVGVFVFAVLFVAA